MKVDENVRRRFLDEPGSHLILAPDFTIVYAGPDYLRVTMTRSEDIVGKNLFKVFPKQASNGPGSRGIQNIRLSLERARDTLETDKIPAQRYDILDYSGELVERWWEAANIPVLDENGKLEYIVHRIQDVTVICVTKHAIFRVRVENRILYLLVMGLLGVMIALFTVQQNGLAGINHRTCLVQRNSLPASHALTNVIVDIHSLITTPLTARQKIETPRATLKKVDKLNTDANIYIALEAKVPHGRKCN